MAGGGIRAYCKRILVIVGLYGIVAYLTERRRNGIGIRLSF